VIGATSDNQSFKLTKGGSMKLLINLTLLLGLLATANAYSHCQIPCGIYDDHLRVELMREDVTTIEKSLSEMRELAGKKDPQSLNQMTRWVMNKEQHAQKIIDIISDYFLTQRVKPEQKKYDERLAKHHAVIVAAMKAKQSADMAAAKALRESIEAVAVYYPAHEHK